MKKINYPSLHEYIRLIIVTGLLFIIQTGYSQQWKWAKGAHDVPLYTEEVAADASGNNYMTHHDGAGLIAISKTDDQGTLLWEKNFGCACPTSGNVRIAVDNSSNIYFLGRFIGTYTFGGITLQTTPGDFEDHALFLVKLDPQGNVIWATKAAGPSGHSTDRDLAIDPQGNVVITGNVRGNAYFGTINSPSASTQLTTFVAKYNGTNGNVVWAQRATGGNSVSLDTDSQGNVYAIGSYSGYVYWGGTTLPFTFGQASYLVKFDQNGSLLWGKRFFGNLAGIASDGLGNSYVAGSFQGSLNVGNGISLSSAGDFDMMIIKHNTNGDVLWARSGGGTGSEYASDLDIDQNGNSYVIGGYRSTAAFGSKVLTFPNGIYSAGFTARYKANGAIDWVDPIIPYNSTSGRRISTTPDGISYILFGFAVSLTFGSDFTITEPNSPVVLAKLDGNYKKVPLIKIDEYISCFPCWPWEIWIDYEYRFWNERYGEERAIYRKAFTGDHRDEVFWQDEETLAIQLNEEGMDAGSYQFQIRALLEDGSTTEWTKAVGFEVGGKSAKVFPNPVRDVLNIHFTSEREEEIQLQLYNGYGKLILSEKRDARKGLNEWKLEMPRISREENPLTLQLNSRYQGEQRWQLISEF